MRSKALISTLLLLSVCLAVFASANVGETVYAESRITHRLDLTLEGKTLICVRTAETVSMSEWSLICDELRCEYPSSEKVIVTRDAMIYHRVKRIKTSKVDDDFIAKIFELAECRYG